ncbi:hypothetical protein GGTG_13361 [Gaeumannomyces tritici R3-111a-1]|uniref:Uncharacterized protein n=1 Tax=Gaeumannomyces tritici (strain R3-111a-1) TaxID=644352 RepID=J3PIN2_GAET3|nr:hypothetical protein GGTG_13361 [Gaeumannomyces tritici R3-111a-1]EJT69093.1 hypothetical protein GGTG_13361 [Gaeumannomyces tritici R3-111a-1]
MKCMPTSNSQACCRPATSHPSRQHARHRRPVPSTALSPLLHRTCLATEAMAHPQTRPPRPPSRTQSQHLSPGSEMPPRQRQPSMLPPGLRRGSGRHSRRLGSVSDAGAAAPRAV